MTKIDAQVFLKIWEKVAQKEHLTDRGLSLRLGITPSAVAHWRSGRTAFVMPGMLGRLEKKLGYEVEFKEDGSWQLHKIGEELKIAEKREEKSLDRGEHRFRESLVWPVARKVDVQKGRIQFGESGGFSPLEEYDLKENIWVPVDDDSMNPLIPKGSWLLVQKNARPDTGEIGVIGERSTDAIAIGMVTRVNGRYQINPGKGKIMSFDPREPNFSHRVLAIVYPRDPARMRLLQKRINGRGKVAALESQEE